MTEIHHLDGPLHISGQLTVADLDAVARAGVRRVINNRPDDEEGEFPAAGQMRELAAARGIAYHHFPIPASMEVTPASLAAFRRALSDAEEQGEGKVLAHCRTGRRSALLWAYLEAERGGPSAVDALVRRAAAAGQDLSSQAEALRRHARQTGRGDASP